MKKKLLSLLLLPLLLTSCGKSYASFKDVKAKIDNIQYEAKYPKYTVVGSMDFNGEFMEVEEDFDADPEDHTFTPYSHYNEGYYNAVLDSIEPNESDVLIHGLASSSYWLRAPLRIHKDNFYAEVLDSVKEDESGNPIPGTEVYRENRTCAHYILEHIITSYIGQTGATNPSKNTMKFELTADGGFAFIGNETHTKVTIDNYPHYPTVDDYDEDFAPLPCYKNVVNVKANIRLEYNAEGWLIKEELISVGYNYNNTTASQVALRSEYSYQFN